MDLSGFNALTNFAFIADPVPLLAELRASHPVLRINPGVKESFHFFRYDDIRAALLDPESFSPDRRLFARGDADLGDSNLSFLFNNMISATGERHRRLRMIGNRVFMPKMIEAFRPRAEAVVAGRLAFALAADCFDLVEDFAVPITISMIAEVLGLPKADLQLIREWSMVLAENSGAPTWMARLDPEVLQRGRDTGLALAEYFAGYIAERRRRPREGDLISAFMTAEVDGQRLSDEEVLSMAMLLLLAGNETTTNLITNFVRALARFPDQAAALRANLALVPDAIEETVRYASSIRNIDRFALRDLATHGVDIPSGSLCVLWLAAANRDPEAFTEPDRFLAGRSPNRHLGFGGGAHLCLGAPLARMEAGIAAREILTRTREVELAGPPILGGNANFNNVLHQKARFLPG